MTNLTEAYVSVSALKGSEMDPRRQQTPTHQLRGLMSKSRRFRFIEGPVQYALLAKGSIDVAMDAVMHPWDIAALAPCIVEAGGVVSDLEGHREALCTKNTSWALIERPYSCPPQAVGAVYDRPGFFVQSPS
ncbi:MAG: hypothetical protein DMG16_20400 [Acidobacteria bacterium]|nr:MAG: hypothetical protein DMG16_20400 [Acidobacteriota bacterium]